MKKRMLVSLFCGLSLFLVVLIVGILRHMAIVDCILFSLLVGVMDCIVVFSATSDLSRAHYDKSEDEDIECVYIPNDNDDE